MGIDKILKSKDDQCMNKEICMNNGKCNQDKNDFYCDCNNGYSGRNCQNCLLNLLS